MMNSMIILLKGPLYILGQLGMNLEKSNKKKSCVRKIFTSDETLTSNPKTILSELELFYSNLYKTKNDDDRIRKETVLSPG